MRPNDFKVYFLAQLYLCKGLFSLAVRTVPFHGKNAGSIPVRDNSISTLSRNRRVAVE